MPDLENRLAQSRHLSQMLVRIAEQSKADFALAVEPFDIPVQLARALLLLGSPEPMVKLADQLACDPSYVTGLADGLEQRGLVARLPGEDRRVKMLALTEPGERLRSQVATAVAERSLVMRQLTDSEREALGELLGRLLGD